MTPEIKINQKIEDDPKNKNGPNEANTKNKDNRLSLFSCVSDGPQTTQIVLRHFHRKLSRCGRWKKW